MTTSNYDEIRRVRHEMSAAAGHDVHKLIAAINKLREQHADKIIAPGKRNSAMHPSLRSAPCLMVYLPRRLAES